MKKLGALIPSTLPPTTIRSQIPPGLRAATSPIGMPSNSASNMDDPARRSVAGKADANSSPTPSGRTKLDPKEGQRSPQPMSVGPSGDSPHNSVK